MHYWCETTGFHGEAPWEEIQKWAREGAVSHDLLVSPDGVRWMSYETADYFRGRFDSRDRITAKQHALLLFLGVPDIPETKLDAACKIDGLARGVGMTAEEKLRHGEKVGEWFEVRHIRHPELYDPPPSPPPEGKEWIAELRQEIRKQKSFLKKAEDEEEKEEIQELIDELLSNIEEEKQHMADEKRFLREEAKAQLHELWEAMGPAGYWSHSIKRPTKKQVRECMEELDRENPQWDDGIATALHDRLIEKFPDLRKKTRARHGDDYYTVFHSMDVHIGDGNEHAKAPQVPFAADLAAGDTDDFYTKTARRRRRKEKEAEEIRQGITIAMIVLLALATVIILVKSFS